MFQQCSVHHALLIGANTVTKLMELATGFVAALVMIFTFGCAANEPNTKLDDTADFLANPWAVREQSGNQPAVWQHLKLPGKRSSQFAYVLDEGRPAIKAYAHSSASMLRQSIQVVPSNLDSLKFSWKLPDLIQYADMSLREFDDSPVRVVLAFEGDRSKFSAKNAMLSELAQLVSGEPMPYATLMYVWCNSCEPEEIITNPHTDRIRKLPLESGSEKLNRWIDYERSIRNDFVKAFGEEHGLLSSISIMTDTDNTKSTVRAFYGPVQLLPRSP